MRYALVFLLVHLSWGALWSQDQSLIGAWDGDVVVEGVGDPEEYGLEIRFEADGKLVYIQKIRLGPPESGSDPGGSSGPSSDSDSLVIVLEGTGTWRTEGENIWLEVTEITLDDATIGVLTEFAKGFARFVADALGISDEDYPAFEQEAVEEFMAEFEDVGEGFVASGTYAIEGQVLTLDLADDDGMSYEFGLERVGETPVREISWGRIKERMGL